MIKKYLKNIEFDKGIFVSYLRFIVGGYFIYASLDKIADPYAFARVIESYEFSSSVGLALLDTFLALVLPWLELILGCCLILGTFINETINMIIILLLLFIIMLFQAHFKGLDISCGCMGDGSSLIKALITDFILLICCVLIKFRFVYLRSRY